MHECHYLPCRPRQARDFWGDACAPCPSCLAAQEPGRLHRGRGMVTDWGTFDSWMKVTDSEVGAVAESQAGGIPPSGACFALSKRGGGNVPGKRKDTMDIREMLTCLRKGESDRAVAKSMGIDRKTVGSYRAWAAQQGLLEGKLPSLGELHQLVEAWRRCPANLRLRTSRR